MNWKTLAMSKYFSCAVFLFPLIVVSSCRSGTHQQTKITAKAAYSEKDTTALSLGNSGAGYLFDTLNRHADTGVFNFVSGDWFVKAFPLNNVEFAVVQDSMLNVYKLQNGQWQKLFTERNLMSQHHFIYADVNNDGYTDVIQYDDYGSINKTARTLLYKHGTKTLEHKPAYDLENLEIDKKKKLLRSSHAPHSMFGPYIKTIYQCSADSPELVKSVMVYLMQNNAEKTKRFVLKTTTMSAGKIVADSVITDQRTAFSRFRSSLWIGAE